MKNVGIFCGHYSLGVNFHTLACCPMQNLAAMLVCSGGAFMHMGREIVSGEQKSS
jgi:hypothetical protein